MSERESPTAVRAENRLFLSNQMITLSCAICTPHGTSWITRGISFWNVHMHHRQNAPNILSQKTSHCMEYTEMFWDNGILFICFFTGQTCWTIICKHGFPTWLHLLAFSFWLCSQEVQQHYICFYARGRSLLI